MGYIDSDAHVYECDDTWNYLDPGEREFRPLTMRDTASPFEQWLVGGQLITRGDRYHPTDQHRSQQVYPAGVTDLSNVAARVAHMDQLGVDVQVIFSTFFIRANIRRPIVEAALARSFNRFMAEKWAESNERLRWALRAPVRTMDRALEELEFGKAHGAAGVHFQGRMADMVLDDEYLYPIYAKAQDLDLPITIHVGHDRPGYVLTDSRYGFEIITDLILGFHRIAVGDVNKRFPNLKFGWMEAGASWVPFVLHEAARSGGHSGMARGADVVRVDPELLASRNLYVACQIDDDIPYLTRYAGPDNLVVGTDYAHLDIGSDLAAHRLIASRSDLDPDIAQRVVDRNARVLFGIDPAYTPAPAPSLVSADTP